MTADPRLISLVTAVPGYRLAQEEIAESARSIFADTGTEIERLLPVYANAGIQTRYSCVPADWYLAPTNWQARNQLYIENAVALMERATVQCLQGGGLTAAEVDTIVTVSSTGISTPSLDARLMERLPFRRDLQRLPVFGLGCAGGVLGLSRAGALARAAPGSVVLLLVVELCGLTFRANDMARSNIIATALFGDGAAAALVTTDRSATGPRLSGWGEHTWPRSLDVMGWRVEDDGFGVLFSQDIPAILRMRFGAAADDFLARQGLTRQDLAGYICHPGGAKVIDALEEVLDLAPGGMTEARAVLRDYGNMSAATVHFVLERVLASAPHGRYLMTALGPGFTAGFLLLEVDRR